jgi:PAS domain S-box-containing protein
MEAVLTQRQFVPVTVALAVGIAVSWLTKTPFGLLAPIAALCLLARGRAALLLHVALAVGLAGAVLVAASNADGMRDVAQAWAALFAVALCIDVLIETTPPASPNAEAWAVARDEAGLYPVIGPTPREKIAPRSSPIVGIAARDDTATPALMLAASFWGGTPFHLRYRRIQPDGSSCWTEVRTEPSREPGGTQQWRCFSADVGDEGSAPQQPIKVASNPPNEDEAVQAARIVESLLGNAWAFDATGRPTYLSPFAQSFVAVTLEEFQASVDEGDTVFKRTSHPDEYDRVAARWRHSLQSGEPFYTERRIRRASGIHDWSRTAIVPVRDRQGAVAGWYGASMDLDAYRTAEVELLAREQELSQLVDMVPSHVWRLTPDGEPTYFNKRMVDFLGLTVADTNRPGKSRLAVMIGAALHPDDASSFRDALTSCLASGEVFAMRYRLRRADGVYRWMSSRAEPMRDHTGRILHWYGLCHDIDDQMHAEEALRERERTLRQLVETLPAMIDCAAPNGEPIYRSQQLREFLGYELEILDGEGSRLQATLDAGVHPDDLAAVKEDYARSLSTGEPYARRHRLRRFDGEYRWVETRAAPMRNLEGAIVQWNVICLDIDGEVRAQIELRSAQEKMARASQAASLAELSASIAHEVNQPLAAIVATSHACRRWLSADPPNLDRASITLERIIRDANSASDVVSHIRALFSQASKTRTRVDMAEMIREVCSLLTDDLAARSTQVETEFSPALPQILVDRVQMQQVLVNLIRNAIDAMEGVVDRSRLIRIRAFPDGPEAVRFELQDHGVGLMEPERAFEPFFTTKQNGMGMGLAICRSIIESHDGRLWIPASGAEGTTLAFTLPIEARVSA